jgi:hypothetical protein
MHFSWLGSTAVKIQTKPHDKDVTIVIDTYKQKIGAFPRNLTPDIGLYTNGEDNSITLTGNPFVLSTPGECETKGVLITAAQGHTNNSTMVRVDAEDLSVGHLGRIKKQLTDKQLEVLSGVDILMLSVGNPDGFDAEAAVKAVNSIEPRIVIPIDFKSDNDPTADKVDSFLKEIGATNNKAEKKVIIKKKDLPQEETNIITLVKE